MTYNIDQLVRHHPRDFADQQYVYPVISRRSRGISVGVNLSPTGLCNFRCVYCQVDGELRLLKELQGNAEVSIRKSEPALDFFSLPGNMLPEYSDDVIKQCRVRFTGPNLTHTIDLDQFESELRHTLSLAMSGELFKTGTFAKTPPVFRRVNDIAFSGNGEPTLSPQFPEAVRIAIKIRNELQAFDVKPIVITNATMLQRPGVREAIDLVFENDGKIWAKLDAGTQAYYELVDRSRVPFETIIANIIGAAKRHPITIQTLILKMHDEPMPEPELQAYIDRLNDIRQQGGQIKLVQLYTSVRGTAEPWVSPLDNTALDAIANRIRNETNAHVDTFYGG